MGSKRNRGASSTMTTTPKDALEQWGRLKKYLCSSSGEIPRSEWFPMLETIEDALQSAAQERQPDAVGELLERVPKDRFIGVYKMNSVSDKWVCGYEILRGKITDFIGNTPAEAIKAAIEVVGESGDE